MPATLHPDLVLGVPEIDQQHQEFVTRLDKLLQSIRAGSSRDEAAHTMAFLRGHVAIHLATEEALMDRVGFPEANPHREEHAILVREIAAIESEFRRNGPTPALVVRLNGQISGWLREHIQRADRELATFMRSRPA